MAGQFCNWLSLDVDVRDVDCPKPPEILTVSNKESTDTTPSKIDVYGWCILYKKEGQWVTDPDDEYSILPAHYMFPQEAFDRVEFLRERGITCRVAALLREETDTPEEFERSRIDEPQKDSD